MSWIVQQVWQHAPCDIKDHFQSNLKILPHVSYSFDPVSMGSIQQVDTLPAVSNLDDWLTEHRGITSVNFQLDAQNSLFIYLYTIHLLKSPTFFEQ